MRRAHALDQVSIPFSYAQLLLDTLAERGIEPAQLIESARIPISILNFADARISPRQWSRLVLSAFRLSGDSCLGYDYGLRMRPTAHGMLGYAMMSAATLGDALSLLLKFFSMRLRYFTVTLSVVDGKAVVSVMERMRVMGADAEDALLLRRFFHECVLFGGLHMSRFLLQREVADMELHVDWQEPACHLLHQDKLPVILFGMRANQIRFDAAELAAPLPTADAVAFSQAIQLCELERLRSGADEQANLAQKVRAELVLSPNMGFPGLEAIAQRLALSARTLKRRLKSSGVTFLGLLEEARRQEAENLLATTSLPIQEIARQLGYLGPANFTRAFRKWTMMTPSEYRQRQSAD